MAIVSVPDDAIIDSSITCVLCGSKQTLDKLSAGMCDADGRQVFACESHTAESLLINGWADYIASQRLHRLREGRDHDEWPIY